MSKRIKAASLVVAATHALHNRAISAQARQSHKVLLALDLQSQKLRNALGDVRVNAILERDALSVKFAADLDYLKAEFKRRVDAATVAYQDALVSNDESAANKQDLIEAGLVEVNGKIATAREASWKPV